LIPLDVKILKSTNINFPTGIQTQSIGDAGLTPEITRLPRSATLNLRWRRNAKREVIGFIQLQSRLSKGQCRCTSNF